MSTQGIVSKVVDGQVVLKIIAGDNGYNAGKIAHALQWENETLDTLQQIYDYCLTHAFGCADCLVVMGQDEVIFQAYDEEELDSRYRETFNDPRFNPRWDVGTADYIEVINESKEQLT